MMTTIELPLETDRDVVMTCVVLHNILRSQYQGQHGGQQPGGDDDDDVPGDGRLIGDAADCVTQPTNKPNAQHNLLNGINTADILKATPYFQFNFSCLLEK